MRFIEESDLDDVAAFWETAISLPQIHRSTHFTLVEPHSFLGRHGHGPSCMARWYANDASINLPRIDLGSDLYVFSGL
jgi:hypothetical protein